MVQKKTDPMDIYYELMLMNGGSFVFQVAAKMGFLQALNQGEKLTAKQLSKKLNFEERPCFLILEALDSLGLMNREKASSKFEDIYSLSQVASFLTGNYQNLSAEYWNHLPTLLKEGTPFKKMDAVQDSEKEYQVQVKSLEWMLGPTAKLAAEMYFSKNSKKGLSILDVGAGSGIWSFSMLYHDPTSNVTLADWPAVLEVANDSASKNNISDKVKTIEGNFHETNWPSNSFDVCTLGNVTHILTAEANKGLFKKISKSLKEGGELIIYDVFSKKNEGSLARSLYKLGLCIRTMSGEVFEPEEMEPWLKDAGFQSFEFESLDIEPFSIGALKAKK